MRVYTVHAPPDASGIEEAERLVFVKDGIAWPALFFPVLWLPYHRLWLPFLGYLLFVALVVAFAAFWLDGALVVAVLGAFLLALEANNLRRWRLERRGWRLVGEALGRDRKEAEFRYFHEWARETGPAGPMAGRARSTTPGRSLVPAVPRRRDEEPGLGLFPEPER